jgi:hypothetical protein
MKNLEILRRYLSMTINNNSCLLWRSLFPLFLEEGVRGSSFKTTSLFLRRERVRVRARHSQTRRVGAGLALPNKEGACNAPLHFGSIV